MSIPGSGSPLLLASTAAAADAGYVIPKSLRFNNGDSANLSKTFSSAGNRRTWTWSGWVKRGKLGTGKYSLFGGSGTNSMIRFNNDDGGDNLRVLDAATGGYDVITNRKFRDTSAWYHFVVAVDTTQSTAADRVKIYVNGVQETSFFSSSYPTQNAELTFNNNISHTVGYAPGSTYHDGLMADVQFVDGQALAPTDFGETRSSDGVWVPKEASFTSPNDGTVWSANNTGNTNSGLGWDQAFNGLGPAGSTGYVETSSGSGSTVTINVPFTKLEFAGNGSGFQFNGTTVSHGGAYTFTDITSSITSPLTTIKVTSASVISAIRVDGVILTDGAGKYGKNGFHLNFSDSSTNEALGFDSAPTTPDPDPKKGFDVITYTGNGGTQNIGGLNFEPGLIWIKERGGTKDHNLYDSIRGATKELFSNGTGAENTLTNGLTSFNPDGFTLGSADRANGNTQTYVAWTWRAGGPAVANTSGTITSQVSVNTDYGFSICSFDSPSSYSSAPFGHGLPSAPKWVILKDRNGTGDWTVYHAGDPSKYFLLNTPAGGAGSNNWTVTSTTVDPGAGLWTATNSPHIAYCWSEVSGYSKFGSYTGNGTDDGPFIETGFKPRWILIKSSSASNANSHSHWLIYDTERSPSNEADDLLLASGSNAEFSGANTGIDILDNGFKLKADTGGYANFNTNQYIYAAFADRPGNNWDVNNIVTNEGLTTSKTQFDVVTYTGNGGTQKIGGPVFSSSADSGLSHADGVTGMFDGSLSTRGGAPSTDNSYKTLTDGASISASTGIRIYWNGVGAGQRYIRINGTTELDDGSAALTPGWSTQSSFSGTINKIEVKTASSGSWSLAAVEVDGTILIDGTGPGLKFQPDLVWLKSRSNAYGHMLIDSVRGAGKELYSHATDAEEAPAAGNVSSFNSDGFTLASRTGINGNGATFVAWCWKAGGAAVSNTDGTITSSVSANAAYGFSIVTASPAQNAVTIGHGLNAAPALIISKSRTVAYDWNVFHKSLGTGQFLRLNTSAASQSVSNYWGSAVTSTTFGVASGNNANNNGDMVYYCFTDVPGYQRIGSYTGNGSSTGPVVVTGFKPRFLLVKRTDSGTTDNWALLDNERDSTNPISKRLFPNLSNAESDASGNDVDFLANGFQPKNTNDHTNANGGNYIYLAIGDDEIGSDEDCLVDVPNAVTADAAATDTTGGYQRGNYAVLNPLDSGSGATLSNGNLDFSSSGSSQAAREARGSIAMPAAGKYFFEVTVGTVGEVNIGLQNQANGNLSVYYRYNSNNFNNIYIDGSNNNRVDSYTDGDVIGVAYNSDDQKIRWYKNGVAVGSEYSLTNNGQLFPHVSHGSSSGSATGSINFGQMRFKYPMPSGYAALNTTALPAATIADGSAEFDVVTYTGNGGTRSISSLEFSPDWLWFKTRNTAREHYVYDTLRGPQMQLYTDLDSQAETGPDTDAVSSFDSNGWTMGGDAGSNNNNDTYVAWAWNAGSSTVSNTDGSITSSVRASTVSGFSIVSYTGNGIAGATIGHGLNAAPQLYITKRRNGSNDWETYHGALGATFYGKLNRTDAFITTGGTARWNDTEPTNSVFSVGTSANCNASGGTYIAYCFAPVAGYSAFGGPYTGTGDTSGPFQYCGFKPRWIMIKSSVNGATGNGNDWTIFDTARAPYNETDAFLEANTSNAEYTGGNDQIDILSNGFKPRQGNTQTNHQSNEYIWIAFAENPFSANGGLAR